MFRNNSKNTLLNIKSNWFGILVAACIVAFILVHFSYQLSSKGNELGEDLATQATDIHPLSNGVASRENGPTESLMSESNKKNDLSVTNKATFSSENSYVEDFDQVALSRINDLYLCKRDVKSTVFTRDAMKSHFVQWENNTWIPAQETIFKQGNKWGIGLFHAWWLSFIIDSLQPRVIVESGALQGRGTYMIRQAAPSSQIVVVSPDDPSAYRDPAKDSIYFTGEQFQDFSKLRWIELLGKEKIAQTLIFFDDHQAADKRLRSAYEHGFKHFVFDDNYLPYKSDNGNRRIGDSFSPKQMCDAKRRAIWRYIQTLDSVYKTNGWVHDDSFGRNRTIIQDKDMDAIYDWFHIHVKRYIEAVPLFRLTANRFKIPHEAYLNMTEPPLFGADDPIGSRLEQKYGQRVAKWFNNMIYVELW